jgi:hypothetical protein
MSQLCTQLRNVLLSVILFGRVPSNHPQREKACRAWHADDIMESSTEAFTLKLVIGTRANIVSACKGHSIHDTPLGRVSASDA